MKFLVLSLSILGVIEGLAVANSSVTNSLYCSTANRAGSKSLSISKIGDSDSKIKVRDKG